MTNALFAAVLACALAAGNVSAQTSVRTGQASGPSVPVLPLSTVPGGARIAPAHGLVPTDLAAQPLAFAPVIQPAAAIAAAPQPILTPDLPQAPPLQPVPPDSGPIPTDETRGTVDVPLDWDHPTGSRISISYRFIGPPSKPLLVFFNGGPGAASSDYVSLDRSQNALDQFIPHFRILLIDQRGTGRSAPLDLDSPDLNAESVIRLFGARQHAGDAQAVLSQAVGADVPFWILAHSYGAQIAFHFLADPSLRHAPQGVIFASPSVPYEHPAQAFLKRRLMQRELNERLLGNRPDLQHKIVLLKERIRNAGYVDAQGTPLDPSFLSVFWQYLGMGQDFIDNTLSVELDRFLDPATPISEIDAYIKARLYPNFNLLNYALSATELFPGYSDARLASETDALLAREGKSFADWMFNETDTLLTMENRQKLYGGKHTAYLATVDGLAQTAPAVVPLQRVRDILRRVPSLFIAAESDSFFHPDSERSQFEQLHSGAATYLSLSGDHYAAFSDAGVSSIRNFVADNP